MKAKLLKKTARFWYAPPLGPGLQVEGKTPHALTHCLPHKPILPSAASGTNTCSCITPVSKAIKQDTYCNVVVLRASPSQYTGTGGEGMVWSWVHSASTHHTWVWSLHLPEITSCRGEFPLRARDCIDSKHWGKIPPTPHTLIPTRTTHTTRSLYLPPQRSPCLRFVLEAEHWQTYPSQVMAAICEASHTKLLLQLIVNFGLFLYILFIMSSHGTASMSRMRGLSWRGAELSVCLYSGMMRHLLGQACFDRVFYRLPHMILHQVITHGLQHLWNEKRAKGKKNEVTKENKI